MPTFQDDGDFVHALGFVAAFAAYMEFALEDFAKAVSSAVSTGGKKSDRYKVTLQARQLREVLRKFYQEYDGDEFPGQEFEAVSSLLDDVLVAQGQRNQVLHAAYYIHREMEARENEGVARHNKEGKGLVTSRELYDLSRRLNHLEQNLGIHQMRFLHSAKALAAAKMTTE
jgi:hypothetical protein